jgi:hypothetical protein
VRYTERDGLFNNGVFQILEDGSGNLWMSCNRGIYRVKKQELNAFAEGRLRDITSVAYGKSDGMLNVECNGGLWPAGIRTRDGKLWFPTQDGIAVIDPATVRTNPQPPPVVIETALLDRVPTALHGTLRIPPGRENLEIEYTALSFVHADEIRCRVAANRVLFPPAGGQVRLSCDRSQQRRRLEQHRTKPEHYRSGAFLSNMVVHAARVSGHRCARRLGRAVSAGAAGGTAGPAKSVLPAAHRLSGK